MTTREETRGDERGEVAAQFSEAANTTVGKEVLMRHDPVSWSSCRCLCLVTSLESVSGISTSVMFE